MTKATLPVGALAPPAGETVAVKVTDWPYVDGVADELTAVVVLTVVGVVYASPVVKEPFPLPVVPDPPSGIELRFLIESSSVTSNRTVPTPVPTCTVTAYVEPLPLTPVMVEPATVPV